MKNHRKLKPDEIFREDDILGDGFAVYPWFVGDPVAEDDGYRLARPDPDYPGWRFGDAGELALHCVDLYGVYQDMRGATPLTADSETRLMEWPEDPRLAE